MLALTSPINNIPSTYTSGFAPGNRFARDLTDGNVGMSEFEDLHYSKPGDTASSRQLANGSSSFAFQK